MTNISICICTRRRPNGLRCLLTSFENLLVPPDTDLLIVIIENDSERRSEEVVNEFKERGVLKIAYCLEKNRGIVYARNRAVAESGECDFCCFTDDDQTVPPDWISELMKCQKEFNADGVAGPTLPLFVKELPSFIKKLHLPKTYPYGTIVKSAYTGNLLIRKKSLKMLEGPFDLRMNFSGGEDSFMTESLSNLGAVIRFSPEAFANEVIPEDRSTVRYLIKKAIRISNTRLIIDSLKDKNFKPAGQIPRLILRFFYGLLLLLPCLTFCKDDKLKGLMKMVNAIGGFSFFFGRKSYFYKK